MSQLNSTTMKVKVGLILFVLGLSGVLSTLTMDVSLPLEVEAILLAKFTPDQLKWVLLLNPLMLLVVTLVVGLFVYAKVNLQLPIISYFIGEQKESLDTKSIVTYGLVGGFLAGVLLGTIGWIYKPLLPAEFMELGEKIKPTLLVRFLYGGITEEILLRFGLMSFVIWLLSTLFNRLNTTIYWIGIVLSGIVFALAHLPIAFQAVQEPSSGLISYILIGNSVGGLIFGWLYWKKGLEAAIIAHMITHVVFVIAEAFML